MCKMEKKKGQDPIQISIMHTCYMFMVVMSQTIGQYLFGICGTTIIYIDVVFIDNCLFAKKFIIIYVYFLHMVFFNELELAVGKLCNLAI